MALQANSYGDTGEIAALVPRYANTDSPGVNGSGRFGPTRKQVGRQSRFVMIMDDVQEFVAGNELGMERLGAARDQVTATEILTRDTDEAGDTIHPIFQRKAFGNVIANWDR